MNEITQQLEHETHQALDKKYSLCFLAHDIAVSMNIGSFFRIADALGVEKLYLSGKSIVPPNGKLRKASRSTEKYVAYEYFESPLVIIEQLKSEGYKIVSLELAANSIDLADFKLQPSDKVCLILGSENEGVSESLLKLSDEVVHIPMLGENSSMNVAVACSIATYQITQQLSFGYN